MFGQSIEPLHSSQVTRVCQPSATCPPPPPQPPSALMSNTFSMCRPTVPGPWLDAPLVWALVWVLGRVALCDAELSKTKEFVEIEAYDLLRASPPNTAPFEAVVPLGSVYLVVAPAVVAAAAVPGREVSYSTDTRTLLGFELPNADWL